MSRTVLALESSCDETAAAVLRGCGEELAHVVASQAPIHALYGGVVPEVASRNHLAVLPGVVARTLCEAGVGLNEIDAFAATTGPGLAASLLVGAAAAKGLALGTGRPFLAVNHIEGHLLSPFFGEESIPPHVGLVVSGGHTLLVAVEGFRKYRVLGRTRDDAAGEAFDKVAKLLGLEYPGGAEIERLARSGDPQRFSFPRGMLESGDFDFSFSGLKTAVRYLLEKGGAEDDYPAVCAAFQDAVVEVLVAKLVAAARFCKCPLVAVSGGVSANQRLQEKLAGLCSRHGLEIRMAPPKLRTDNALMIAYVAAHQLSQSFFSAVSTDVAPHFDFLPGS